MALGLKRASQDHVAYLVFVWEATNVEKIVNAMRNSEGCENEQ